MKKKLITTMLVLSLCGSVVGCTKQSDATTTNVSTTQTAVVLDGKILSNINISSSKSESVGEADTFVELGESVTVKGDGVTVDSKKITITSAGTYSVKGTLTEGQIIVDAGEEDKVYIILNGVNITCSNNAPIYVKNSKKTIISLSDNTENYIKDGENYVFEDGSTDEPNAAIFSKSDLIFIGNGSLAVDGKYNNGITSKDDLKIESGNIVVNAKADGLRGKDSVVVTNGNIIINSGEDGIKSNNDEDSEKGYVLIEGGKINITSGEDGIQAETNVFIKEGDITINSGGGSLKADLKKGDISGTSKGKQLETTEEESTSSKAIKAGINIITEGGTFNLDAYDDAVHSNNNLVINAGTFNLSSGDDGLHSDSTLTINNGSIDVEKSYEGIESETITINDGEIMILSSDDGINVSGNTKETSNDQVENKSQGSPAEMKGPGGMRSSSPSNGIININGGYITVNADGDGIDSNGSIYMKGGTAIVNGPTKDGNGSLDYDGNFEVTGGTLIAAGSLGMAQAPSEESTQNSVKITLATQSANTLIRIESKNGEEILTFAPQKQYSSVVISSPKLKTGEVYKVYLGGSSTGSNVEGLYSNGTYTNGKEIGSFTIASSVSEVTQEGVTITNRMGGQRGQGVAKSKKQ
jgi:hypothetical protein